MSDVVEGAAQIGRPARVVAASGPPQCVHDDCLRCWCEEMYAFGVRGLPAGSASAYATMQKIPHGVSTDILRDPEIQHEIAEIMRLKDVYKNLGHCDPGGEE